MKRRKFIQTTGVTSLAYTMGMGCLLANPMGCTTKSVNKREAMLSLINDSKAQNYYPGAFFMHFEKENLFGEGAINRHMDYFRAADLDIIKIQYEKKFPLIPELQKPADWANVPLLKKDFYEEQLKVIEGIVKRGKKEALIIATVYSPVSFAGHFTAYKHHINHLNEDPIAVKKGLEIITESTLLFVKECVKLGVDGFFQATQGGEVDRFEHDHIFTDYIKPFDIVVGQEIANYGSCNILHICDGAGNYNDYSAYVDYPAHIINCSFKLENKMTTAKELYREFNKPIMGGLDKNGVIANGPLPEIVDEVKQVISEAPEKFVLGASCTVPRDTPWKNIRTAMDIAHTYS